MPSVYSFSATEHLESLQAIIDRVMALGDRPAPLARDDRALERRVLDNATLGDILRCHPRPQGGFFSKAQILHGFRELKKNGTIDWSEDEFLERMRMKPIRTASGVAPVTVLTRPHPCPGRCIFCPSDVRMPKSYLSDEPGAQRAAEHQFDPWCQTTSRLLSLHNTGHRTDKIELIILGGTWSFYPESYQLWFTKRCFDALNDFDPEKAGAQLELESPKIDYSSVQQEVDGLVFDSNYNQMIQRQHKERPEIEHSQRAEIASWSDLLSAQVQNETAAARCVGLVVETRPDRIDEEEVRRIRRLGGTKVQIGYQSLNDQVLQLNKRGHDVDATRRAMRLLRQAGFKIHAHWMPNLYGSSPQADRLDYEKIFQDPSFRPDELKIYPCSLIESAELMQYYDDGRWAPYDHDELLEVLVSALAATPRYCRLTRVIRDIPGTDIVVGNKLTNFRQIAEQEALRRGVRCLDIRSREVGELRVDESDLSVQETWYQTEVGRELFLEFVNQDDRLAGFARLSLPEQPVFLTEIEHSAMLREVHVYGSVVALGDKGDGRAQHLGLGRRLVERCRVIARQNGFDDLAVISAIGTREYYRRQGFVAGELYMHLATDVVSEGIA